MKTTVNTRVAEVLKTSRIDEVELAARIKKPASTIYRIVNGETKNPSRATVQLIATALNISFEYLYNGIGDRVAGPSELNLLQRALTKLEQQLDKKDDTITNLTQIIMNLGGNENFLKLVNNNTASPQARMMY